jgi:hypothetical protein
MGPFPWLWTLLLLPPCSSGSRGAPRHGCSPPCSLLRASLVRQPRSSPPPALAPLLPWMWTPLQPALLAAVSGPRRGPPPRLPSLCPTRPVRSCRSPLLQWAGGSQPLPAQGRGPPPHPPLSLRPLVPPSGLPNRRPSGAWLSAPPLTMGAARGRGFISAPPSLVWTLGMGTKNGMG